MFVCFRLFQKWKHFLDNYWSNMIIIIIIGMMGNHTGNHSLVPRSQSFGSFNGQYIIGIAYQSLRWICSIEGHPISTGPTHLHPQHLLLLLSNHKDVCRYNSTWYSKVIYTVLYILLLLLLLLLFIFVPYFFIRVLGCRYFIRYTRVHM